MLLVACRSFAGETEDTVSLIVLDNIQCDDYYYAICTLTCSRSKSRTGSVLAKKDATIRHLFRCYIILGIGNVAR
jgi:hypothetical protein